MNASNKETEEVLVKSDDEGVVNSLPPSIPRLPRELTAIDCNNQSLQTPAPVVFATATSGIEMNQSSQPKSLPIGSIATADSTSNTSRHQSVSAQKVAYTPIGFAL